MTVAARMAVVVPTFRRKQALGELLTSIFAGTQLPDEVVVVDNDPLASCEPDWPKDWPIKVVHAGLGLNLAGARNQGWRASQSDLCVFLDDDNTVAPETLGILLDAASDKNNGLIAPVVFEAGEPKRVWCAGVRRSLWTTRTKFLYRDSSRLPADQSWGTDDMPDAFAVPRQVLEEIGGFDEDRFPFHYDEADLGMRIRRCGFETRVIGKASVRHSGGVAMNQGSLFLRAYELHGSRRVELMARGRPTFHGLYSSRLQRLTTFGIFIPLNAVVVGVACLLVDGRLSLKLSVIRAFLRGLVEGYRIAGGSAAT